MVDTKEIRINRQVQKHTKASLLSVLSQSAKQSKKKNLIILYIPLFATENILLLFPNTKYNL